jgi:hypothetical protein
MKLIALIVFAAQFASGQVSSFTWGTQYNYSNQYTGINGWPNNGRHGLQDTTRATVCLDGNTYVTGNDGYGPNYILGFGTGRDIFLTTMTPFTTPGAGVLQTLVNSMDDWGNSSANPYGNNTTPKSSGLLCQWDSGIATESMYWSTYQQSLDNPQFGSCTNILRSDDHGATWWNPFHVNHSTGVPTQAGSATGDLPTVSQCEFPSDIKSVMPIQYCTGNKTCPVIDGNDTYIYGYAESQTGTHMYGWRILSADIKKGDGTLFQWYDGPVPTSQANFANSSNYTFTEASHVAIEPTEAASDVDIIGPPIYLPAFQRYMTVIGTTSRNNLLFQGVTPFGPWSQLHDFAVEGLAEGWHAPMLGSVITSVLGTSVNYMVTNGPGGIVTDLPQNNTYGPMFHTAQFTGSSPKVVFPMPGGVHP